MLNCLLINKKKENGSNRNAIQQKDAKKTMDRICKQRISFREKRKPKGSFDLTSERDI